MTLSDAFGDVIYLLLLALGDGLLLLAAGMLLLIFAIGLLVAVGITRK